MQHHTQEEYRSLFPRGYTYHFTNTFKTQAQLEKCVQHHMPCLLNAIAASVENVTCTDLFSSTTTKHPSTARAALHKLVSFDSESFGSSSNPMLSAQSVVHSMSREQHEQPTSPSSVLRNHIPDSVFKLLWSVSKLLHLRTLLGTVSRTPSWTR